MSELTEALRAEAVKVVAKKPGVGSVRSEDVDLVARGMAHAVELILADLAERRDRPETPKTARVELFNRAVPGAIASASVRLESGRRGLCSDEPSSRTTVLIATDRALVQERIANGEWLK